MRILAIISFILAVTIVLAGCGGGGGSTMASPSTLSPPIFTVEEAQQHGAWTVLIYLDADNDLEAAAINNFNQMETIGSTKDVRVVVQVDRRPGYDSSNGDWTDTRRYLITRDTNGSTINSIRLDEAPLGEKDMGDWRTLREFVQWGTVEFPADNYCLVLWDHGSGWQFRSMSTLPQYKYVISDDTSSSGMNVTDIPSAIDGLGVDVIAFDACYMMQLEIAYQLRNSAGYMVGSAATEPSPGYDYSRFLRNIGASTTPRELSQVIVEQYALAYPPPQERITQSAIDLSKVDEVAVAASSLGQLLASKSASYSYILKDARESALNYSTAGGDVDRFNIDLVHYAEICAGVAGTGAMDAYTAVRDALSAALVAETHNPDMPEATGLAIYLPPPTSYDSRYEWLDLSADTYWDDWIRAQRR